MVAEVLRDVPLGPLTTLRIGGPAARLVVAERDEDLVEMVRDATRAGEALLVLGGGSNLVVGDAGFAGTVVRVASRGIAVKRDGERVVLEIAAGESWDALVARAVGEGWAGIESMSGIPGLVGATPIQNVGAYGQEVSETLVRVIAYDRDEDATVEIPAAACGFGYRASRFKGGTRFVVLRVELALEARPTGEVRYAELARALGATEGHPAPLARIRETVLALRRKKGMVLDAADPDAVSAGSFFVNPVVTATDADGVEARARRAAVLAEGEAMPRFAAGPGKVKLSAGWLVERAGFHRGYGAGSVGVSRKHALALVNRGEGSSGELLALARAIRDGVRARFAVELTPEPVMVGCVW